MRQANSVFLTIVLACRYSCDGPAWCAAGADARAFTRYGHALRIAATAADHGSKAGALLTRKTTTPGAAGHRARISVRYIPNVTRKSQAGFIQSEPVIARGVRLGLCIRYEVLPRFRAIVLVRLRACVLLLI